MLINLSALLIDKSIQLIIRLLQIVVDEDLVKLGRLGPGELVLGPSETLLDALLGLGAAASQALLELLVVGGCDEDVASVDARSLDLLDALHLDVEDYDSTLGCLLFDRRLARTVEVASELSAVDTKRQCILLYPRFLDLLLDKSVVGDQLPESLLGDKVVLNTISLAISRTSSRVRHGQGEDVGVAAEEKLDQRALADTAGAADDEGSTVGGRSHCEEAPE